MRDINEEEMGGTLTRFLMINVRRLFFHDMRTKSHTMAFGRGLVGLV